MDRYIRFVLKRPIFILVVFSVITVILSFGIFKLQFDTTISTFMPQNDPEYKFYTKAKEIYGDCDTFVILSVTHKNLMEYNTFNNINNLLIDIEEFMDYNPERETGRINQLNQLLSEQSLTGNGLLLAFNHDPAFQRLIARKIDKIGGGTGILSKRAKEKLTSEVAAANELKARQMIDEIISPFTMKDIIGEDDMLETIRLIDTDQNGQRIIPKTDADFQTFIQKLHRNPLFEKGIYATDAQGNITDLGIIIRFQDIADSDPIAREILQIVDSHKELDITPQGEPIIYIWVNNYMQQDLIRLVPLVMLVAIIIFFLNFKSVRGVLLPFVTLSMATVWILGLMGILGCKITTVGISIPILMIAVGSSYGIHILNQYYADYDLITIEGKAKGLQDAMAHISTTVLLAGLTTLIAFMTLATHQLSAIREWGIFSALGIAFAVLISSSIIPAGLELMPHKVDGKVTVRRKSQNSPIIDRVINLMSAGATRHYKKVLTVVAVLIVVSVVGLFKLNVETELLYYFKHDNYIRTSAKEICDKYGGRWGFNILIDSGEVDGVKNTQYLNLIADLRAWLVSDENKDLCVGRTDAFSDYIKTMNMAMNNDDPASFKIPDTNMGILDYLEIYSDEDANSDGRVDSFEPFVDTKFQTCNVLTRLGQDNGKLIGTATLKRIFNKVSDHLTQFLPPGYSFKITGHPCMLITSVDYIVNGQIQSLLLSFIVIGLVVFFLMKDIKVALLSLIPMSIAVIFNFGIMGWFGINLDIATSIIAAITIGIGVDDTIHFLNTFRHYRKQGEDVDTAIEKTLHVAGKAIIFTSLALIFGFSVLELSTFKPLILFGLLMAVTMVATTIGALLILPSAIKFTKIRVVKPEAIPVKSPVKKLIPVFVKKH